jgi:protein-S-isoprenylcysteine O-methyltransferase Ste14
MRKLGKENLLLWLACILMILCFPLNPLVLADVIEPNPDRIAGLFYLGWVIWAFGMGLVMAPVILFPRRGGVARGKSFVHTTRLVDTGIYAVVRHPQYLGGILSIFVATPLLYQHWLFMVLGIPGAILVYLGAKEEEKRLMAKFGDKYKDYMESVPRIDILTGAVRRVRRSLVK